VASITLSRSTANYTLAYNHNTNAFIAQSFSLAATVLPANAANKTVTWSSGNSSVATVSTSGYVTVVGIGTATITARCGGVSAACVVTAEPVLATSVVITPSAPSFSEFSQKSTGFVPAKLTLTATVYPTTAHDNTVTWTNSSPGVATFSSGVVTPKAAGTTTITAKCGTISAAVTVTVTTEKVASISLSGLPVVVTAKGTGGETDDDFTPTVTITPGTAYNKALEWSSDNTSVATVDKNTGKVTPLLVGSAGITAKAKDGSRKTGTITVTVSPEMVLKEGFSRAFVNGRVFTPEYTSAFQYEGLMHVPIELFEAMILLNMIPCSRM
jgi:uncharacterized protein YjdB